MFVTSISFRGTFKSFWDLTGKSAMMVQNVLLRIGQPYFYFFGFESTLLARQLHQERTQMEAQ